MSQAKNGMPREELLPKKKALSVFESLACANTRPFRALSYERAAYCLVQVRKYNGQDEGKREEDIGKLINR